MSISTKIFMHDTSREAADLVKNITDENNLIGIKSLDMDIVEFLMNSELSSGDLSAIFLTEEEDSRGLTGFHIAEKINQARSSLPVFMRLRDGRTLSDLTEEQQDLVTATYTLGDAQHLQKICRRYLFAAHYPMPMVNLIRDLGRQTLEQAFRGISVVECSPFLVKDHMVSTYFASLIPLEVSAGKGYLLAQMRESDISRLITASRTHLKKELDDFDHVHQLVSEIVNMLWGKIRHAMHDPNDQDLDRNPAQVPIIINYLRNYVSFGNVNPQLCFRYLLYTDAEIHEPVVVDFKAIFNVRWEPSKTESEDDFITQGLEGGDLELF